MAKEMMCKNCGSLELVYDEDDIDDFVCDECGCRELVKFRSGTNSLAYRKAKQFMENLNISIEPENTNNGLTDEEILSAGMYPKDEMYKMSLISRILGKRK